VIVRQLTPGDQRWKEDELVRGWGSTAVARKGELVDASELPGFVAELDGEPAGLLTFARRNDDVEVVTLHVRQEGRGVGRALMDAMLTNARDERVRRIWLTTTNDNVRAIAFYQRWGMNLVALIRDGVAGSRLVKPSIPMIGGNGIPVAHELEFELLLDDV
jgi:ribosomal protein S18 acetylase RimI-like enzyme